MEGAKREFDDGEVVPGTRYRVLRLIGSGGMGSVYEVEHLELGKKFVLKALLRDLASRKDLEQRMRNEWRALARLQHKNIVDVTDAGTSENGVPFYVMQRLDGDTLSAKMRAERKIAVPVALRIAADILDGLSAAHAIDIVHRDVKPPNIFLTDAGEVKLLDFGIAKVSVQTDASITGHGVAVGTPRYMSPEQVRGEVVDARADLYAVGLVLYEMIAGRGPFDDKNDPNDVIMAHLTRRAPPLSKHSSASTPELDRVVASLLAKKQSERPTSASGLARELRALAESLKLPAPPSAVQSFKPPGSSSPTRAEPSPRVAATVPESPKGMRVTGEDDVDTVMPSHAEVADTVAARSDDTLAAGAIPPSSGTLPAREGLTVPIEQLAGADDGAPAPAATRTALPVATTLETPPPVSGWGPTPSPPAPRRRWRGLGATTIAAGVAFLIVGGGLFAVTTLAERSPADARAPAREAAAAGETTAHARALVTPPGPAEAVQALQPEAAPSASQGTPISSGTIAARAGAGSSPKPRGSSVVAPARPMGGARPLAAGAPPKGVAPRPADAPPKPALPVSGL